MVFSLDITLYLKEWDTLSDRMIYISLQTISYDFSFLFLELAIMLNISKWIYFYLVILTHRKIRYDEIFAEMMYELEGNSKEQKKLHLKNLKIKSNIL